MKNKYRLYSIIISLFLIIVICSLQISCNVISSSSNLSREEMRNVVIKNNLVFNKGITEKNPVLISKIYTDSALYVQDNEKILIGTDQILEQWRKDIFELGLQNMILDPIRISGNREIIYESGLGKSLIKGANDKEPWLYTFKYVNVWVLQTDGSYKLDIDCYNNQLPSR